MDGTNTKFFNEQKLPLVIESIKNVSFTQFLEQIRENSASIKQNLLQYGGILFRGFPVEKAEGFNAVVEALGLGKPLNYIGGDTPRNKVQGKIYTSTEAPPSFKIPLHNEMSFIKNYPRHIYFYCETPPQEGGETIIADSRQVYTYVDSAVREKFEKQELKYVTNFYGNSWLLDLINRFQKAHKSWMEAFETHDKKEVKFKCFLEKSLEMGADLIATGHYCRKIPYQESWVLGRGADPEKDQSYFLYTLKSAILNKVLFPLGELKKSQVREIATRAQLATAQKKDSTGICFIGKRNFKQFLSRYIENVPGEFRTASNKKIGIHDGVHCYTIGQRRGLNIGGPGEAWYVVGKDVEKNVVFVEQGEEHPALYRTELTAQEVTWIGHPPQFPFTCTAKIRYRSEDVVCRVDSLGEEQIRVVFETMQKAITSRQSIVFYQGELCLGGGIID